jgi:hypothetical protein
LTSHPQRQVHEVKNQTRSEGWGRGGGEILSGRRYAKEGQEWREVVKSEGRRRAGMTDGR